MKKATRQQTRNHNTQLVLKTIYEQRAISRAAIARATHLTRPTVSTIVSDLLEENLITEAGLGPSAGGKRPTLLEIKADAHRLLCLDLGSRYFRGALVNLRGGITERAEFAVHGANGPKAGLDNGPKAGLDNGPEAGLDNGPEAGLDGGPEAGLDGGPEAGLDSGDRALELVYRLVDHLQAASPVPLLGIGIGSPGLIDPNAGVVRQAVNLGWRQLPLKELLEERYGIPTYVANDSQAAALGEFTFGVGSPAHQQNLILIRVGQGIGAGIVLRGQPFYGDSFAAGEIGHVVVASDGPLCSCGNRGCLEMVAGTRAYLQQVHAQAEGELAWQSFTGAYDQAQPDIVAFVEQAGRYLGMAIANLVAAFNVHHIVISGRVSHFGERFLLAARQEAARRALPALVDETILSYSVLGTDIVILGSSALVLRHELGIV